MAVRVAINGFGRIGRLVLRAAYESGRKDIEFVAINDLGSIDANALLLQRDTIHGAGALQLQLQRLFHLGNATGELVSRRH